MISLGDPGMVLADRVEAPWLSLETAPGSGSFWQMQCAGNYFTVDIHGNAVNTAIIDLNLGGNLRRYASVELQPAVDWKVVDTFGNLKRPEVDLINRRVRIQRYRGDIQDRWTLFDGYVEKAELAWSGSSKHRRAATLFCTGSEIAADRERSQQMYGQWRRCRQAEMELRKPAEGEGEEGEPEQDVAVTRRCVRTPVPLIFNPDGKPNCHPIPLVFADKSKVYIFTDTDDPAALPWTVAKMLRYIQWAAVQTAPPSADTERYDVVYLSRPEGLVDVMRDAGWTDTKMRYECLDELLDLDLGGEVKLLDHPPDDGQGDNAAAVALLRDIPSVACDVMSALEALFLIADRAGILFHTYYAVWSAGLGMQELVVPKLLLHVPGYLLKDDVPDETRPSYGSRAVWLKIATDNADRRDNPPLLPQDETAEAAAVAATNTCEGVVLIDHGGRRRRTRVLGDPTQHELTVELVPGWKPGEFDVAPGGEAAAEAILETPGYFTRYVKNCQTGRALRYWVLNEDGQYTAEGYKREHGPFSGDAVYEAYNFARGGYGTEHPNSELYTRGDQGWSCRRRRFLPGRAKDTGNAADEATAQEIEQLVEFSCDGGVTWFELPAAAEIINDRCAMRWTLPDLRNLYAIDGTGAQTGMDFVQAYIYGQARVRVTAAIETDDQCFGEATAEAAAAPPFDWADTFDRRGHLERKLRTKGYSVLRTTGYGFTRPGDLDSTGKADGLARRLMRELQRVRVSGKFTLPYLMERWIDSPWPTYGIGDEIVGIDALDGDNNVIFVASTTKPIGPRVIGQTYRWPENVTEVQIEDGVYEMDDVVNAGDEAETRT